MAKRRKANKDTKFPADSQPVTASDDVAEPLESSPQVPPESQPDHPPVQDEEGSRFWETLGRARQKANQGDRKAQQALCECLRNSPQLRAHLGSIAGYAGTAFTELMSEGDYLTAEAIRQEAAELRRRLCSPDASLLEELAVHRLVACWQQLQYSEMLFVKSENQHVAAAKYWLKRREQAHKVYESAAKSLMQIWTLLTSTSPSDAAVRGRPLRHEELLPVADDPSGNGDEPDWLAPRLVDRARISREEQYPVTNRLRPANGYHHRLTEFLAAGVPES